MTRGSSAKGERPGNRPHGLAESPCGARTPVWEVVRAAVCQGGHRGGRPLGPEVGQASHRDASPGWGMAALRGLDCRRGGAAQEALVAVGKRKSCTSSSARPAASTRSADLRARAPRKSSSTSGASTASTSARWGYNPSTARATDDGEGGNHPHVLQCLRVGGLVGETP